MLGRYLLVRLLLAIPTTFAILLAIFALVNVVPTQDPIAGSEAATGTQRLREARKVFREHYGLHLPVFLDLRWRIDSSEVARKVAAVVSSPPDDRGRAIDDLESCGRFAVASLVGLASDETVDDAARDAALRALVACASPVVRVRDPLPERDAALALLREITPLAPPETPLTAAQRDELGSLWKAHLVRHAARYAAPSGLEAWRVTFSETRFATYLGNLAHLDFGNALADRQPVLPVFCERVVRSALIGVGYLVLSFATAIPLALFIESRRRRSTRRLLDVALFAFFSLPGFFSALLLQRWFAGGSPFRWFPSGGWRSLEAGEASGVREWIDLAHHLALPVLVLALPSIVVLTRLLQGSLAAALASDYVAAARARGLSRRAVLVRHALRTALLPLATTFGALLPILIGGAASVEFMFDIPGVGLLMLDAALASDYNVILAVTIFSALATQAGFLVSDALCAWLDPRIRFGHVVRGAR